MSCSKTDIEKKRLAALDKIRSKANCGLENNNSSCVASPVSLSNRLNFSKKRFEPYTTSKELKHSNSVFFNAKVISGTTYLISTNRFEVKPSEFSEQLINIFKTIPSKIYDSEKKLWNFSIEHYEELHRKILPLSPHIVLGGIPQNVLNIIRQPPRNYEIDLSSIDPYLKNQLMPFQVEGVNFGIEKKGRCLIADDMGLGKTFQALAIAHYYLKDWPLLIITTSSMRGTWESKIHELIPSIPMMNIVSISSVKEKQYLLDKQAQIIITSYSMSIRASDSLLEKKFGVVILDESHLLKSYKAQSTECVTKLTKTAKRVILLSGTPALSRPSELFTQLQIIDSRFFGNFTEYGKRYCAGKQTNFGWDMGGQSNLPELQAVLTKKFLIRRTKEQVLSDLKEKTRETVLLDSHLVLSKEKINDLALLANTYERKKSNEKHGALLTFFCETAKVKIPAICKYVSDLISEKKKFLIFAHHKSVLDAICQTLDECRIHYICIDGSTKTDHRTMLVDKFQFNDSCQCAVLSITAANAGITLTAAQLVVFAELHWNPGILTQAEARAHRIGQQGGVSIKYLIAKGTADDLMWPMLENKLRVLNQVGLSKDTFKNVTLTKQASSENTVMNYMINTQNKASSITETSHEDSFSNENPDLSIFLQDNEGDELLANFDF